MAHSYATLPAFERLMLLITTFVRYPGVGCADPLQSDSEEYHNALQNVLCQLQKVAEEVDVDLPAYSVHTIQKDLKILRRYGLLDRRTYRWGYYLGSGAMSQEELQVALNALHSQAKYQQDPQISTLYQTLTRRLRGLCLTDEMFYPVRTQLNRVIVYTDPEEMMSQSKYRGTLFEHLQVLEAAIIKGKAVEIFRCRSPYKPEQIGPSQVYPLQLIYVDIAWYLLHENCQDGHLAVSRLDRFSDHFKVMDAKGRGVDCQWKSLGMAHQLLETGWGLKLGSKEAQQLEKQGQLEFVEVIVRFFPDVVAFILEAEKRHPSQNIKEGPKGKDGKPAYVDYIVKLPPRSLDEFCRWVYRFMGNAEFRSPLGLVEKHKKEARAILARYPSAPL